MSSAAHTEGLTCALCLEIYRSPRLLPCHHTFCLDCIQKMVMKNGNVFPCPACRRPVTIPEGGAAKLQVNYYISEPLQRAHSFLAASTCDIHIEQRANILCKQCDEVICMQCKVTQHEGHAAEDLFKGTALRKTNIQDSQVRLQKAIEEVVNKRSMSTQNELKAKEKRAATEKEIQARYNLIVAWTGKWQHNALQELQRVSDSLEEELAAGTQLIEKTLNSLLGLQERSQQALSSDIDLFVSRVNNEMIQEEGSVEYLKNIEKAFLDETYRPGLYCNFTSIEDDIRTFIGSPVKLTFPSRDIPSDICVIHCGDEEKRYEVHAVREKEDRRLDIIKGRAVSDWHNLKQVTIMPSGETEEFNLENKESLFTRKNFRLFANHLSVRVFGSKGDSMFSLRQNYDTGKCLIYLWTIINKNGEEKCTCGNVLMRPNVYKIHNFDAIESGQLFAVIDEESKEGSQNETSINHKNHWSGDKIASRVVRLYQQGDDDAVATYDPPTRPFFPTDICFSQRGKLLISDWLNDYVHIASVDNGECQFIGYLPESGDIVRPTALNLDLQGNLLIGCSNGQVLKCSIPLL